MTKKQQAFQLLEEGATPAEIAKKLNIAKASVATYKYEWKKSKGIATTADLADSLFGPDEEPTSQETTIEDHQEITTEEFIKQAEEFQQENKELTDTKPESKTSRLNEISRSVTYKGEYGTYEVTNTVVQVVFDTAEMCLENITLSGLIEELEELSKKYKGALG